MIQKSNHIFNSKPVLKTNDNQISKIGGRIPWVIMVFLLIFASACEKENELTEKGRILTNGVWKITLVGIDSNMNNQLSSNEIKTVSTCEKENTWDYKTNGKLVINDLGVICDPTSIISRSWAFRENETFLEIKSHGGAFTITGGYHLLELSQDKMLLVERSTNPQIIFEFTR
jgi:hypothetical protein